MADVTTTKICRYRGDTDAIVAILRDKETGEIMDLTGYANFTLTVTSVENPTDDTTTVFKLAGDTTDANNLVNGKVVFNYTTLQDAAGTGIAIETIVAGNYFYDIQQTDAIGGVKTVAKGEFELLEDNTKTPATLTPA